ncbi:MAG: sodium:solute symporter family protein [Clostridiales bacterium]|nr:sodium:solute symporter family protein [Clostridiales bacterium]
MTALGFIIITILFILLMVIISLVVRKSSTTSMQQFGKAKNRFGLFVISVVCMGSWVGSGGLIGLSNSAYTDGIGVYWEYAMAYIALVPWMFLYVRRIKILDVLTTPDFFALRYSKYKEVIRYPSTIALLARTASVLGMQLSALAFLFTTFLGWERWQGVVVAVIMVFAYTIISGLVSIMVTNTIQSILQTIAPFAVAFFAIAAAGGWDQVQQGYEAIGEPQNLSLFYGVDWGNDVFYYFISVGLFFFIGDQSDWQRVNAASSAKTARNGFLIGTIIVLPILVLPCIGGAVARQILPEGVETNQIYFEVLKIAPPAVGTLLLVGALATILSCVSAYLFAGGTQISNDIIIKWKTRNGESLDEKQKIFYTRLGIGIHAVIGIAFALWISGILSLFMTGLVIAAAGLLVPYFFAWHSRWMNTEGAFAGIIAGSGLAFTWFVLGSPFGIDPVWLGIPASFVACVVVRLITPPPTEQEINSTHYYSEKFKLDKASNGK